MRETWTDERLDDLNAKVDERFDRLEDRMDRRFESFEERLGQRFDRIDARLDSMQLTMVRVFAGMFGVTLAALATLLATRV